jgi:hypothetical protein
MILLKIIRWTTTALAIVAASIAFGQGNPEKDRIHIGYAARAVVHSIPYDRSGFIDKLYARK